MGNKSLKSNISLVATAFAKLNLALRQQQIKTINKYFRNNANQGKVIVWTQIQLTMMVAMNNAKSGLVLLAKQCMGQPPNAFKIVHYLGLNVLIRTNKIMMGKPFLQLYIPLDVTHFAEQKMITVANSQ
ncbi:UNKNOWN [Stylonychia lemnae]|uniref:Uncharacterized protein n=1 Tax=Stylonychia lemnae TaxID=5949 RepID=A0A078AAF1_STYLE|nr:UNKNOWN [Stylonychia lemnae]|eukprot:CDW77773.1 UNKNOWN [Stylonychia lemnae]